MATAFHNVELKEDVFMEQPEGVVVKGQKQLVCKLQKSLYDLKQSPRCWNEALHAQLLEMGFNQSPSDPCIYITVRWVVCVGSCGQHHNYQKIYEEDS